MQITKTVCKTQSGSVVSVAIRWRSDHVGTEKSILRELRPHPEGTREPGKASSRGQHYPMVGLRWRKSCSSGQVRRAGAASSGEAKRAELRKVWGRRREETEDHPQKWRGPCCPHRWQLEGLQTLWPAPGFNPSKGQEERK